MPFHLLPKTIQRIRSLAVTDVYYMPRIKVYDNSLIDVSFTDSKLVNAYTLDLLDAHIRVIVFYSKRMVQEAGIHVVNI